MRRYFRFFSVLASVALGLVMVATPSLAAAFSGYGAGTSSKPYRISTCAQLHEIDNNLAGYYVLVTNIDCAGSTFAHLANGASFTGTLDGQDHTITNLTVDNKGLFAQTEGATIKNIAITNGSMDTSYVYSGGFVGYASNTTMQNLHSDMTIASSSYGYLGGIAGFMSGSTVSGSSFTGSLSGTDTDSYLGGITGFMWIHDTNSITDSFVTGTITPPQGNNSNGGIAGGDWGGTIARVYSAATIDYTNSNSSGGLIGLFNSQTGTPATISDSFAANTLTTTGSSTIGAVFGQGDDTATNNYYDAYLAGLSNCSGSGGADCTAKNSGNSQPNYFKNNSTNTPLDTWDFANVWTTTAGYPTLRNLQGFSASGIPNNGDANGDGVQDSFQANVANVKDSDGRWTTVEIPSTSGCTLGNAQSVATSGLEVDDSYAPLVNMASFSIYCTTVGATVPVTLIYDKQYSTTGAVLRYYNSTTKTYSTVSGVAFGTKTIGGTVKTTATYQMTDGGALDSDGVADGVIVDPVGLAGPLSATLANTGLDILLTSAIACSLLITALFVSGYGRTFARKSYKAD